MSNSVSSSDIYQLRVTIRGAVQGVGFRPYIYRLAAELDLSGWIVNSSQGVFLEVEGTSHKLREFLLRVESEKPPRSFIQSLESAYLDPVGYDTFEIRESDSTGEATAIVLPDIATCPDCLDEVLDPADRRYRYPFTNCTNCGPRYSIIEGLPYDRPKTTMREFVMCRACQEEYDNPLDRRFHAQPNACPECGPGLELWDRDGNVLSERDDALLSACDAVRDRLIVAVKGLGGFHLIADARNDSVIEELRRRKGREEKPFALMYPNLEAVNETCNISDLEERLLLSPESPIVLLRRKDGENPSISQSAAPNNPYLGIMLPYTPLHHLMMLKLGFPVVATSGNLSDEPICIDEREAVGRLSGIADLFLIHNRPITRHVDDSIVRVMMDRELVLRRARGFAPLPVPLADASKAFLAVGGHLKNTVAIAVDGQAFVSQHIGDLETAEAMRAFDGVIGSLSKLYDFEAEEVVRDLHPDYLSSKRAVELSTEPVTVQHHYAHVLACMAENGLQSPVLGVAWDGTGYGLDGTVWGGEFLMIRENGFQRYAHLRSFRLPGGEKAIREPRRSALGLLYELYSEDTFDKNKLAPLHAFDRKELKIIKSMITGGVNTPVTTSAGRLFDAVASILDIRQIIRYEGQAAMELEFSLDEKEDDSYPYRLNEGSESDQKQLPIVVDWEPMIHEILSDIKVGLFVGRITARFHNTLSEMIVSVAKKVKEEKVCLSGGCFQNRYLTERTVRRLNEEGFRPYWHQRIPPNDGGISLGQLMAASISGK